MMHLSTNVITLLFPKKLEWIPNLYVAGCFADLELGPFGRNVMGGRKAAERIEQAFLKLQQYSA